jgi:hypothetical protein
MAASLGYVRFVMTFNGPDTLPPSLLEKLNAYTAETCKDSHGFTYAYFKINEPMLSTSIEDIISDWNIEHMSEDDKIRFHPFYGEEKIVPIADDDDPKHFILKKIDEQETEHIFQRPSTYHRWYKLDESNKKRKASEDSDNDDSSVHDLEISELNDKPDKYAKKTREDLKVLLFTRDDWIHEKNRKIESLLVEIKSREIEIAKIEEKLRAKDDVIKNRDEIIKVKDEIIKAKDEVTRAKDQLIMHMRV